MRSEPLSRKYAGRASAWQRWALNIGAILGTLCLLMALCTVAFGLKPLIFASGSMGPEIPTGSLGFAIPTATTEIQPGEIVSVVNSEGTRITHRVVENEPSGLILKGDANEIADFQPYVADSVDRLLFAVPVLGYVMSWFSQPWAFFVGGLLCAYLLYLAFGTQRSNPKNKDGEENDIREPSSKSTNSKTLKYQEKKNSRNGSAQLAVALCVVSLFLSTLVLQPVQMTDAAFSANANVLSTHKAVTPVMPSGMTCGNFNGNANTIRFSWNAPAQLPSGYRIRAVETNSQGVPVSNGTSAESVIPGTSINYDTSNSSGGSGILGNLLGLLLGYTKYFTISITAEYGGWNAPPTTFLKIKATAPTLIIFGEYKLTCPASP